MGNEHELICLVDEADQLLGPCGRGEAHRLGLRHRAVHILVFNSRHELLLQKRSLSKTVNPGLWDTSAAGHVDYGEDYDACAQRELWEELGILARQNIEALFKLEAEADTGWEFVQVYRLVHDGEVRLEPGEADELRWHGLAELDAWLEQGGESLTDSFKLLWQRFRELESPKECL